MWRAVALVLLVGCASSSGTGTSSLVTLDYSPAWAEAGWQIQVFPDGRVLSTESGHDLSAARPGRFLGPHELRELKALLASEDLDSLEPRYETGETDRALFVLVTGGASGVTRVLYDPQGVKCEAGPRRFLRVWNWIVKKADLESRCEETLGCMPECQRLAALAACKRAASEITSSPRSSFQPECLNARGSRPSARWAERAALPAIPQASRSVHGVRILD